MVETWVMVVSRELARESEGGCCIDEGVNGSAVAFGGGAAGWEW